MQMGGAYGTPQPPVADPAVGVQPAEKQMATAIAVSELPCEAGEFEFSFTWHDDAPSPALGLQLLASRSNLQSFRGPAMPSAPIGMEQAGGPASGPSKAQVPSPEFKQQRTIANGPGVRVGIRMRPRVFHENRGRGILVESFRDENGT